MINTVITSIKNPSYIDSGKACWGFNFQLGYIYPIKVETYLGIFKRFIFTLINLSRVHAEKDILFHQPIRLENFNIILKTNLRSSSHAIRQLRFPNVASSSKMVLTNCGVAKSNSSMLLVRLWLRDTKTSFILDD